MELKAIEVLKNYKNNLQKTYDRVGVTYDFALINEAIKELEELEDKSCLTCKFVHNCKLANDVKTQFGTKLKEQCFYCWKAK